MNGAEIERVEKFKLLGVYFSSDLSWTVHVDYIVSKALRRLFVVCQLVNARVPTKDIVEIYCAIVRSVLEYACPVWHGGLTKSQSADIENVQKRYLRIIYPQSSYNEALHSSGLQRLDDRRESITRKLFIRVKNEGHDLNKLLQRRIHDDLKPQTRDTYPYKIPSAKTSRLGRSFINYCLSKRM